MGPSSNISYGELIINGTTVYGYSYSGGTFYVLVGSISGNTVSWYNTDVVRAQMNSTNDVYLYEAEG